MWTLEAIIESYNNGCLAFGEAINLLQLYAGKTAEEAKVILK